MKLTITIDGVPPAELRGNGRRRTHWAKQRQFAKDWLWLVRQGIETRYRDIPDEPWPAAQAEVVFVVSNRRRRDADNWRISLKETWDFFVGLGIIPDDTAEHLSVAVRFEVDKSRAPMTIITLTKAEVLGV